MESDFVDDDLMSRMLQSRTCCCVIIRCSRCRDGVDKQQQQPPQAETEGHANWPLQPQQYGHHTSATLGECTTVSVLLNYLNQFPFKMCSCLAVTDHTLISLLYLILVKTYLLPMLTTQAVLARLGSDTSVLQYAVHSVQCQWDNCRQTLMFLPSGEMQGHKLPGAPQTDTNTALVTCPCAVSCVHKVSIALSWVQNPSPCPHNAG